MATWQSTTPNVFTLQIAYIFKRIVISPQHTKRFQKLIELLPDRNGFWVLPHMIVDNGLIVVQQTIFNIIQPIDIFGGCVNLNEATDPRREECYAIRFISLQIYNIIRWKELEK